MDFPTFAMNMTIRSSGLMLDPPSSNLREELFASIVEQLWDGFRHEVVDPFSTDVFEAHLKSTAITTIISKY